MERLYNSKNNGKNQHNAIVRHPMKTNPKIGIAKLDENQTH